jgi:serine/threonine protein kinase
VHEGLNLQHLCIVGEVLSPNLASTIDPFWDNKILSASIACRLAGQIMLGIKYLHNRNVAYGDLRQGNILLRPPTLVWSSQADVERYLGAPSRCSLSPKAVPASPPAPTSASPHVPRYLVDRPNDVEFLRLCLTSLHVKVCDFSVPRLQSTRHLATPFALRPPQAFLAILNAKTDTVPHATINMDVWALAVLIHLLFTY